MEISHLQGSNEALLWMPTVVGTSKKSRFCPHTWCRAWPFMLEGNITVSKDVDGVGGLWWPNRTRLRIVEGQLRENICTKPKHNWPKTQDGVKDQYKRCGQKAD